MNRFLVRSRASKYLLFRSFVHFFVSSLIAFNYFIMNCSFDSTASYSDLFRVTGRFLTAYVRKLKDEENEPSNYVQRPLWFPFRFTWDEYLLWFLFVWFWKFARQIYIRHVGQVSTVETRVLSRNQFDHRLHVCCPFRP